MPSPATPTHWVFSMSILKKQCVDVAGEGINIWRMSLINWNLKNRNKLTGFGFDKFWRCDFSWTINGSINVKGHVWAIISEWHGKIQAVSSNPSRSFWNCVNLTHRNQIKAQIQLQNFCWNYFMTRWTCENIYHTAPLHPITLYMVQFSRRWQNKDQIWK